MSNTLTQRGTHYTALGYSPPSLQDLLHGQHIKVYSSDAFMNPFILHLTKEKQAGRKCGSAKETTTKTTSALESLQRKWQAARRMSVSEIGKHSSVM